MKAVHLPADRAFLRYIDVPGDGAPLLWLHGWQCSSTAELMPAAVQPPLRGRHSLLIDFLGHGYSDKPRDFAYTLESHARTIVALIDALGLTECGLVGHSMGGDVAIHVATARPTVVSLLILAEAGIDADGDDSVLPEDGFASLIEAQEAEADAQPDGLRAVHVGITRLIEPRAIHLESVSMGHGTDPDGRTLLGALQMPRWYFQGEWSDSALDLQRDLAAMGVGWKVIPDAGHPMGLQNPLGLAQAVAEVS